MNQTITETFNIYEIIKLILLPANWPCRLSIRQASIPGWVIPKTQKWYLVPLCLTLRYVSRVKRNNSRKGVVPSKQLGIVAIETGAFGSSITTVANYTLHHLSGTKPSFKFKFLFMQDNASFHVSKLLENSLNVKVLLVRL